ncbi:MAG: response regulator [Clostridiales bacterium]|jgi:two-component system response regulator YesN|nr:response regulator [Clostridiales bacterium]
MYTVLIVDDEDELRQSLIRQTNWVSAGFEVVGEAKNGIDALAMIEELERDLLLTDIKMPFLSGLELARQVREIRPNMYIAFLSGYDDFSFAQQAIQYNIISYILKPISSEEMEAELAKIKQKIDLQFSSFQSQINERLEMAEFLMHLLNNSDGAMPGEDELLKEASACGMGSGQSGALCTVLITRIMDCEGQNKTSRASVSAIDTILAKYLSHGSFYAKGRVISLVSGSQSRLDAYLHILIEDIAQSFKRILGLECQLGISRSVSRLSDCHEAYKEVMEELAKVETAGIFFAADKLHRKTNGELVCDQVREVIQAKYANPDLSLVSVSHEIGVSPNYLSFLVKKTTGSTFIELLTQARICKAKELLLNSSLKVREISELCGYNEQHYFSYCFKRLVGISPKDCRRQMAQGERMEDAK